MKKLIFLFFLLALGAVLAMAANFRQQDFESSDGWKITGYFTPVETDYDSGETREIEIKNVGAEKFDQAFLDTVFDETKGYGEGWGKTRFGWYLGNYNGHWHKADAPLGSNNEPLKPNSIAVDNSLIPYDSEVKIPSLPDGFGALTFVADDVGVTVYGKHIDVYCGEGKDAEQEMDRVTNDENSLTTIYFKKP